MLDLDQRSEKSIILVKIYIRVQKNIGSVRRKRGTLKADDQDPRMADNFQLLVYASTRHHIDMMFCT